MPSAESSLPRNARTPATRSSGASDASGASHCTSRNSSMPSSFPPATSAPANGSAAMSTMLAAAARRVDREYDVLPLHEELAPDRPGRDGGLLVSGKTQYGEA